MPLMPDMWIRKIEGKEVAVRMRTEADGVALDEPQFDVIFGRDVDAAEASRGIAAGGRAISPYDDMVIDGDYIKAEAQAGRMSEILYAVAIRTASGERTFRAPTEDDHAALRSAEARFADVKDV
ncbi:hypothetical protein CBI38_31835 (plasmid) [Rhodococcus oxybenzonivorans]|uniref:Uncharacterized protein n=2 Tax=Rhodococcus oxybenzonivorans TaxID=1990687 RepID=A0A2S2C5R2_9NOCA|nr:hypothetical protein CBI38_31835 [Rhodococcus oxybenzonivorans]